MLQYNKASPAACRQVDAVLTISGREFGQHSSFTWQLHDKIKKVCVNQYLPYQLSFHASFHLLCALRVSDHPWLVGGVVSQ